MGIKRALVGVALGAAACAVVLSVTSSADESKFTTAPTEPVSPGDTFTVTGQCQEDAGEATFWYTPPDGDPSSDKKNPITRSVDDDQIAATLTLPERLADGRYTLAMRCKGESEPVTQGLRVGGAESAKFAAPAGDDGTHVSPSTVAPGGTITVAGQCPGEAKSAEIWYSPVSADQRDGVREGLAPGDDGMLSAATVVDKNAEPGRYEAVLRCGAEDSIVKSSFTVSSGGSGAGGGGALAEDGTSLVLAGGGMLAAAAVGGAIYMQRRGFGVSS